MPPPSGTNLLRDILAEIDFLAGASSSGALDAYPIDPMIKRGVERSVEIVCEAVRQLRAHRPDLASQITGLPQIVGMRHRLAHEFWDIDPVTVRFTISTSFPTLREEAESLLMGETL